MTSPLRTLVPLEGRGDLPFATVHGTALLLHAVAACRGLGPLTVTADRDQVRRARALVPAGVTVGAAEDFWSAAPGRVLLHDSLCPLVPPAFLATVAAQEGSAAGYRPVTDTLKVVEHDRVGGTVDRERFAIVTSPVLLVGVTGVPPTHDAQVLVAWLRERGPLTLLRAPSIGRRVADAASLSVLESVDALARSTREA